MQSKFQIDCGDTIYSALFKCSEKRKIKSLTNGIIKIKTESEKGHCNTLVYLIYCP